MPVDDEQLIKRLRELLETVDLETTSERKLRELLEAEYKEDLKDRKATIRQEIQCYLDRQQEEDELDGGGHEEEEDDKDDGDDAPEPAPKAKSKAKREGMAHFGSILSPQLQDFLGVESMPRTQVVKAIWVYIKAHNLQDPKNKRKIRPDEKLGKILPNCNMLQMNKHLSKHVFTADPRDYEEQEPRPQPKAKAAAEKPAPNKAAASTKAKRKAPAREEPEDEDDDDEEEDDQEEEKPKKRKRKSASAGGGSTISPELQAFLGVEKMGRFQAVKAIWTYIKEHNLQDPSDKRSILPDAKLGTILHAPVTAFSLNTQLSKHYLKSS